MITSELPIYKISTLTHFSQKESKYSYNQISLILWLKKQYPE